MKIEKFQNSRQSGKGRLSQPKTFLAILLSVVWLSAFFVVVPAAEKLVLYSTQILPRSEENLRTVRAAYSLGEFSVFEVVNEQRRLTENLAGYNESLRDYYKALAEIETALGI